MKTLETLVAAATLLTASHTTSAGVPESTAPIVGPVQEDVSGVIDGSGGDTPKITHESAKDAYAAFQKAFGQAPVFTSPKLEDRSLGGDKGKKIAEK